MGGWQGGTSAGGQRIKQENDKASDVGGLYDDQLDISGFFESQDVDQEESEFPAEQQPANQHVESLGMDGGYESG
jgi:hypothetical protein